MSSRTDGIGLTFGLTRKVSLASRATNSSTAAWCTASAAWSSYYRDYDVYVHSNQYDVKAVATASNGASDYWWTDSTGYADIYLYGAGTGDSVKVTVRAATCFTST